MYTVTRKNLTYKEKFFLINIDKCYLMSIIELMAYVNKGGQI